MDLLTGWVDCSSYEGVTSPDYRVFTPTISLDRRFYTYLFQHCYSAKVFYGFGQGVSNFGRWRLPADEFKSFLIPFPPIETQKAISTYLDIKTAEIDTLIEETEKSIELLEEYRKSAISEAVTKGLDPDVPMKDSCIEWIGEIPAHWDICRLGLLVHFHSGKPKEALMKSEDAIYPVYGGGDVKGYSEEFNIDGENVLVSRQGATCGTTRYVIGKAWATEHALIANPSSSIEPKWLSLWLENMNLGQYSMTAAQPGIAASMIESLPMVVLPKEEQAAISETVKELSNEIRATIAQKLLLIQYCHDLRKSLVGEAITGKFKVPGVM